MGQSANRVQMGTENDFSSGWKKAGIDEESRVNEAPGGPFQVLIDLEKARGAHTLCSFTISKFT